MRFFFVFLLNFSIELRAKVDEEVEKNRKVLHKHFRLFLGNGGKCSNKIKFISVEWTIFHHDSPIGLGVLHFYILEIIDERSESLSYLLDLSNIKKTANEHDEVFRRHLFYLFD